MYSRRTGNFKSNTTQLHMVSWQSWFTAEWWLSDIRCVLYIAQNVWGCRFIMNYFCYLQNIYTQTPHTLLKAQFSSEGLCAAAESAELFYLHLFRSQPRPNDCSSRKEKMFPPSNKVRSNGPQLHKHRGAASPAATSSAAQLVMTARQRVWREKRPLSEMWGILPSLTGWD